MCTFFWCLWGFCCELWGRGTGCSRISLSQICGSRCSCSAFFCWSEKQRLLEKLHIFWAEKMWLAASDLDKLSNFAIMNVSPGRCDLPSKDVLSKFFAWFLLPIQSSFLAERYVPSFFHFSLSPLGGCREGKPQKAQLSNFWYLLRKNVTDAYQLLGLQKQGFWASFVWYKQEQWQMTRSGHGIASFGFSAVLNGEVYSENPNNFVARRCTKDSDWKAKKIEAFEPIIQYSGL